MSRPVLPPNTRLAGVILPNKGIEIEYRRRLLALVDDMYNSIRWWVGAEYKRQQPKIAAYDALPDASHPRYLPDDMDLAAWVALAMSARDPWGAAWDASPASAMMTVLRRRFRQWRRSFDEDAERYAAWFAARSNTAATAATSASLKPVTGIAIEFKPTRAMNNAMKSIVFENVSLIKSIPQKSFLELEGLIMRSVRTGRDMAGLADEIEKRYAVTRRRAEFIARDQNNKATEALTRVRMQSRGITRAVWMHRTVAGSHPRHTHVAMSGRVFELGEGLYDKDEGRKVQPGELPNCHCTKRAVIPYFGGEPKLPGQKKDA